MPTRPPDGSRRLTRGGHPPSHARRGVLLLIVLALGPRTASMAHAQADAPSPDLVAWCDAVAQHRPGEFDGPAFDIAPWDEARVTRVIDEVSDLARAAQRLASRGRSAAASPLKACPGVTDDTLSRGDMAMVWKHGAQFHTDIAALYDRRMKIDMSAAPRRASTSITVLDGRLAGFEVGSEHWTIARLLLDEVRPRPEADPAVAAWYQAAAAHMARRGEFGQLGILTQAGRKMFPRDATLALMEGIKHHVMASARVQSAVPGVLLPRGVRLDIGARVPELQQARRLYEDALRLDPALVEARVRLGHVLGELEQPQAAATVLREALATAGEPVMQYYAALCLGEQERRLGRFGEARAALERASTLYPFAQSPLLALSLVSRAQGDREAAVAAIDRLMRLPAERHDPDDPWWTYYISPGRHSIALMARAQSLLLKDGAP